jgi:hypothetical protein
MESKMALKKPNPSERGQTIALYAIILPLMAVFLMGLLDYMTTSVRVMDAVAIGDLAAHAGAQEIEVLPNGVIRSTTEGNAVAATYFRNQAPSYLQLNLVQCGRYQGRPGCLVQAGIETPGFLFPKHWIAVNTVGYLAHGVTREDQ